MTEPVLPPPGDPTRHWDGQQWLKWNGTAWLPETPATGHAHVAVDRDREDLRRGLIALLILAVVLVGAWFLFFHKPTVDVAGTLRLSDTTFVGGVINSPCRGTGGYSDIVPGAEVVVTDEHGTVLGTGALGSGVIINDGCVFDFKISGVEGGHPFYGVAVSHRGTIQYSQDQLQEIGLTLGS